MSAIRITAKNMIIVLTDSDEAAIVGKNA